MFSDAVVFANIEAILVRIFISTFSAISSINSGNSAWLFLAL
ncbi:hypothetical protein A79E_2186 [Klebsiella pneumoniae subsp. pneumoniae 1084]|nr:hypothetical protein A79E_2186 [Klebsiella pneumoniae subsp. pneumoniae 1084]AUB47655.1 hypothetical protein SGH10_002287 [Klebsiella pneumoniae]